MGKLDTKIQFDELYTTKKKIGELDTKNKFKI